MHAQADSRSKLRTALLLLFLVAGGFVFRSVFATSVMPPPPRMQGETTQAYRYTRMVSNGSGIPAVDTLVMRPQGLITAENSIFEEYIAGGIHSVTGGDLDGFLHVFCLLFPLLVVPVIFYWMLNSNFSFQESFSGAALYAVFLPALLRARGESFYRETVALPLIVLTFALIDMSSRKKQTLKYSVTAALVLFLALASWKVTGYLSFFVFVWMTFRRPGLKTVLPLAVSQLLASVVLSHMRHDGAIYSPAVLMAVAAVVSSVYRSRIVPWTGLAVSLASGFFFRSSSGGHVASVIAAKLKFMFSHPENPALLSGDARLFWVSGYTSPSSGQMVLLFGVAVLAAALGWKRFREKTGQSLMYFLVPLSVAGYLFFDRLLVVLAIGIIPPVVAVCRNRRWALPVVLTAFGLQTMYAPEIAGLLSDAGLTFEDSSSLLAEDELTGLIGWAEDNRGTVLSFWHISGLLSAYADMPVVTHTFFENTENRETIIEFAGKIFGTEQEMVAFMEDKGAEYLIYQADFVFDRSPQGLVYLAGLTEIPDGCLAVRLHYYPQSLESLGIVWQGPSIRVYSLNGSIEGLPRQPLWEVRYAPFLDDREIAGAVVNSPVETAIYLADQGMETGDFQKISAALLLLSGSPDEVPADAAVGLLQELLQAHLAGDYSIDELEEDFVAYLDCWGPDPQLRFDLVRLLRNNNLFDKAEYHMEIIERMGTQNL
ncbi:MAG: hypothetical protein J7K88_11460 [Candidatus Fermentibacteraceae bacterium]|nr:hypothetical protein [Candidatus Fermentibacteraceae bacterium]